MADSTIQIQDASKAFEPSQNLPEEIPNEIETSQGESLLTAAGTADAGGSEEATRAYFRHLADSGLDTAGKKMLFRIISNAAYLHLLLDPDFLSAEEARRVAAILRDADPRFFINFQHESASSGQELSPGRLARALRIFEELGNPGVLLPWLRGLTSHPNEHIRSKAVKVLCEMRPNVSMVERQLKSEDPRVRANAIEALWLAGDDVRTVAVFREALLDGSHRVVVNALVGLHRLHVKGAFEKLLAMARSESALVRSAAAWGLGEIGDWRATSVLQNLATSDRSRMVRSRATSSLTLLAAAPESETEESSNCDAKGTSVGQ